MNPAFLAFSAAVAMFLIVWGTTRSALVAYSRNLDLPDEPDWSPGADAPLVLRLLGGVALRANRETGLRTLIDRLPGERMEKLEQSLVQAGHPWGLTARAVLTMQIVGGLVGSVLGIYLMLLASMPWALGLVLGLGLGVLPRSMVSSLASKRTQSIRRSLPSMLDLLVVNAESGRSLRAGFELVGLKLRGPLGDEMAYCARMLQVGTNEEQVFLMLAERTALPEMEELASSLVTSVRFGGVDIRAALQLLAHQTRERWRQDVELKINRLSIQLIFPMFLLLFPSFAILLLGPALLSLQGSL